MRLLVSHHSILSTSKWAGGCYHYLLLWFLWVVGKLEQSKPRKAEKFAYGYRFQVTLRDLLRHQHLTNTLTNKSCDQIHLLILHRDPLAADDGSRKKNSTTLESQPKEIMRLMMLRAGRAGVPDRRGREMGNN